MPSSSGVTFTIIFDTGSGTEPLGRENTATSYNEKGTANGTLLPC
jgi:hypothetical protein